MSLPVCYIRTICVRQRSQYVVVVIMSQVELVRKFRQFVHPATRFQWAIAINCTEEIGQWNRCYYDLKI
jgi:hypothetical protein